MNKLLAKLNPAETFIVATLVGVIVGIFACTAIILVFPKPRGLGATSNGDFPGIYNATPTSTTLRDGYGSALLTDSAGRVIATTTQ